MSAISGNTCTTDFVSIQKESGSVERVFRSIGTLSINAAFVAMEMNKCCLRVMHPLRNTPRHNEQMFLLSDSVLWVL